MRRLLLLGLSLFGIHVVTQTMAKKRYLPLFLFLLSVAATAQTTSTYHVSNAVGRWGYPFRAFSSPFTEAVLSAGCRSAPDRPSLARPFPRMASSSPRWLTMENVFR
jgi:hypothetical protein